MFATGMVTEWSMPMTSVQPRRSNGADIRHA
jgi:hypothetical protein